MKKLIRAFKIFRACYNQPKVFVSLRLSSDTLSIVIAICNSTIGQEYISITASRILKVFEEAYIHEHAVLKIEPEVLGQTCFLLNRFIDQTETTRHLDKCRREVKIVRDNIISQAFNEQQFIRIRA